MTVALNPLQLVMDVDIKDYDGWSEESLRAK